MKGSSVQMYCWCEIILRYCNWPPWLSWPYQRITTLGYNPCHRICARTNHQQRPQISPWRLTSRPHLSSLQKTGGKTWFPSWQIFRWGGWHAHQAVPEDNWLWPLFLIEFLKFPPFPWFLTSNQIHLERSPPPSSRLFLPSVFQSLGHMPQLAEGIVEYSQYLNVGPCLWIHLLGEGLNHCDLVLNLL